MRGLLAAHSKRLLTACRAYPISAASQHLQKYNISSGKYRLDNDKNTSATKEWKDEANCVIIGGGAVGVALAWHLAKKGMSDVILLEKTELTAGSTWHAAGLTAYYNGVTNFKRLHYYAMHVLNTIAGETGQEIGFHNPGSIRLAESETRADEMKYQYSRARWHQAPVSLITPERIHELHPLLNLDKVILGLYNPADGHVDPYSMTQAFSIAARNNGAQVIQHCDVTATNLREDGLWDVATSKGNIKTKHVVNAGGLWAREVGKLAGISLPTVAAHHQYVITTTIPEVRDLGFEPPVIRDLDGSYYLRKERDGLLYGPYERPEKMALCDDWYDEGPPQGFGKELFQPDLDRISDSSEAAMRLCPVLETASIQTVVSGPITYGPDVLPQCGPFQGLHNYWVSMSHTYGIVHSPGFADYLSHYIIHGEPPYELIDADCNRYNPTWCTKDFLLAKARETYGMNNHPGFPKENRFAGRPTYRTTPIYEKQKEMGAHFSFSAGWETADWYALPGDEAGYKPSFRRTNWFEPVGRECRGVLENCGVVDLTSFGKYELTGPDSAKLIDYIYGNEVPQLGEIKVSHMLTSRGTIMAEHTVTCMEPGRYWCITGGGSELHDLRWMENIAKKNDFDISFKLISDDYMVLSVAGPKSRDVMSKLTDQDVTEAEWPFMTQKDVKLAGVDVHAFRLSYTGELGWELFVKRDGMLPLYEAITEAGKEFGLVKFGKFALDALRQEKGMRGWGREMTKDGNALEAGLGMFVKLNKAGDFIGKTALQEIKSAGLKRKLCFLTLHDTDKVDPEGDETVLLNDEVVGNTTSGCYGWQVGSSIAMAYLPLNLVNNGQTVQVQLLNGVFDATVNKAPWVKHETRR